MSWYPITAAVLLAVAYVLHQIWSRRDRTHGLPVVTPPPGEKVTWAIIEGHKRYPDTPFVIPDNPSRVILPMALMNEVIHAPEEQISFLKEVHDMFLGKYTKVGQNRPEVIHTIRGDLTKSLTNILPLIQSESKYAFDKELGKPQDWTSFPVYGKVLQLVALLSGRVFVGLPLSREETWVNMSIKYTTQLAAVQRAAAKWPSYIRWAVAPFLKEVRQTAQTLAQAQKYMEPMVRDILADHDREKTGPVQAGTKGSFISWILRNSPDGYQTAKSVGESQMLISFAAIHTTSMTSSMVLFDLAAHPEYITLLREEAEAVIREDGLSKDEDGNPYFTKSSLAKLRLLDSFIKESLRCNPIGFVNSTRQLQVDYTFSNGLKLPKGTHVAFPMWAVARSDKTPTFSPEYNAETGNKSPEVFDGHRFMRLRDVPGRESRHQAVTTGFDASNFGHGPHACPGRFFAIYEVKVLVLELLLQYDLRLKDDTAGKGGEDKRPENLAMGFSNIPSPVGQLEIRARRRE